MRLCLSKSPECSGLVPCQACHTELITKVIPVAMVAASLNADEAMAKRFFQAYAESWQRVVMDASSRPGVHVETAPTLNGAEYPATTAEPCKACGKPTTTGPYCSIQCAEGPPGVDVGASLGETPAKKPARAKKTPSKNTQKGTVPNHGREERKEDGGNGDGGGDSV